jgi:hypothetical protein
MFECIVCHPNRKVVIPSALFVILNEVKDLVPRRVRSFANAQNDNPDVYSLHRLKKFVIPNSPGEWFRAVNCIESRCDAESGD